MIDNFDKFMNAFRQKKSNFEWRLTRDEKIRGYWRGGYINGEWYKPDSGYNNPFCPITALCYAKTGERFSVSNLAYACSKLNITVKGKYTTPLPHDWTPAARLPHDWKPSVRSVVEYAADLTDTSHSKERARLLKATGLSS